VVGNEDPQRLFQRCGFPAHDDGGDPRCARGGWNAL